MPQLVADFEMAEGHGFINTIKFKHPPSLPRDLVAESFRQFIHESEVAGCFAAFLMQGKKARDPWRPVLTEVKPEMTEIINYERDTIIKRHGYGGTKPPDMVITRMAITKLSHSAIRRMKFTARNLRNPKSMMTLTYPENYPTDGKIVKDHLNVIKQWLRRRGISGFWFLEQFLVLDF